MRMTYCLLACLLSTIVFAQESIAPPDKEMQQLIQNLGSEQFDVREKASSRLVEVGPAAIPHLKTLRGSDDAEVVSRSKAIIDAIYNSYAQQLRTQIIDVRK